LLVLLMVVMLMMLMLFLCKHLLKVKNFSMENEIIN
jgi:hypothetical protein